MPSRARPVGDGDHREALRARAIDGQGAGIMIIAQISDTHIALDAPNAEQRISDLALTIADINALDPLPDAIVHTGDIVHNGRPEEYARAAAILAMARVPVYVLAGNKDDRMNLRRAFSARGYLVPDFDFIQYAIETHPIRLIALDTMSSGNKGDFCAERLRHLTGLFEAETAKPIAVFTHHPPFEVTEGPDPLHFEDRDVMARLGSALRHSGRVVAVFSGHVHRAASGDVAGIPGSVMPAIATALRHGRYPADLRSRPVYQVHRFDPVWGVTTETRVARRPSVSPSSKSTSSRTVLG
jgi:3',5'-cyclic AMP phosphodiesterase CpdA